MFSRQDYQLFGNHKYSDGNEIINMKNFQAINGNQKNIFIKI